MAFSPWFLTRCLWLCLLLCCLAIPSMVSAGGVPCKVNGEQGWVCAPKVRDAAAFKQRFVPPLRSYFLGEKLSGYWWGSVGLINAGVGVGLLFVDSQFAYGVAFPLIIVGGLQVLIGIISLARTDARVVGYLKDIDKDPHDFYHREVKRMKLVLLAFKLIKWVEIGIMATGVGLVTGGMLADLPIVAGVGMGLMITGLSMLLLDLFAQQRAQGYVRTLSRLLPSLQVAPVSMGPGQPQSLRIGLGWQGAF